MVEQQSNKRTIQEKVYQRTIALEETYEENNLKTSDKPQMSKIEKHVQNEQKEDRLGL